MVPVGDFRARPVDIRVVSATNKSLDAMVREGTFRQDLFFRLNVVVLKLPPLRERQADIIPLAGSFPQDSGRSVTANRTSNWRRRRLGCCRNTAGRAMSASWPT